MDKNLSQHLLLASKKSLSFLVDERGFSPPSLYIDEELHFSTVTFMGKNIAIEVILDEKEKDIDCKLARVSNGLKTPYYAVDESGVRVRERLSTLLMNRGVRDQLFTNVGKMNIWEKIDVKISDYARMLRNHGNYVFNDSKIFNL